MSADEFLAAYPSAVFDALRPLQRDALHKVGDRDPAERDLALEMPTGSGKTLVGLLLAGQAMATGRSAVYLTGTIQLSRQVLAEAQRLGMAADLFSAPLNAVSAVRIHRVETGQRLAVLNYWAYFSERELFSPPDILIIDDAHLLEGALESRYGISVTARDDPDLLEAVYDLISRRFPGYQVIDDYVLGGPHPSLVPQLVAFPHAWELADGMHVLLRGAVATNDRIHYPYQRLAPNLAHCLWLAGPQEFLIRPLRYPLHGDPRFAEAGRRVYMSATLGDLGDLRRRLGSGPVRRVELDPGLSQETGNRYIVLADTPDASEQLVDSRRSLREATPRRVWFCRSKHEADEISSSLGGFGASYVLDREGAVLDPFAASDNADLVIGGRFDGIDFSNEVARLAIFPSAPFGVDPFEEFLTAHFGRASYLQARVAERITQALGRMTRGDDDWAVVVLEDPRLAHKLVQRDVAQRLPPRLRAEIQAALDRAEQGAQAALETATAILAGAPMPDAAAELDAAGHREGPTWRAEWVDLEARFGDALHAGTFDAAIPLGARLLEELGDHPLRAWWLYLLAMAQFLSSLQDRRADRMRESLAHLQASVRAAGPTAWFARVEASCGVVQQRLRAGRVREIPARQDEFLRSFRSGRAFEEWKGAIGRGLASGNHNEVAAAWTEVGRVLGFHTSRPSGDGATDSLWRGSQGSLVFEVKIEHLADSNLDRKDVNQLLGQMEDEARTGNEVTGCFITSMDRYHDAAQLTAARLVGIPVDVCGEIWDRVGVRLAEARSARDASHEVSADPALGDGWFIALIERGRGGFLSIDDIEAVWPPSH